MKTTCLAQIAGAQPRPPPQDGDETDLQILAARAAAELPAGFVRGAATSPSQVSGQWYSNLVHVHRKPRGPA